MRLALPWRSARRARADARRARSAAAEAAAAARIRGLIAHTMEEFDRGPVGCFLYVPGHGLVCGPKGVPRWPLERVRPGVGSSALYPAQLPPDHPGRQASDENVKSIMLDGGFANTWRDRGSASDW